MTADFRSAPLANPVDVLLTDIVIRLQLSRSAYQEAVSRYETIQDWIDRDASPLHDLVDTFYPQGSMAIQATVASRLTTDEHDLDVVAELKLPQDTDPHTPLRLLHEAIRGEPGSRYWDKTRLRRRCVTVEYSNMHLDITPSVRLEPRPPRECFIFDAPQDGRHTLSRSIIANPFGFADWFKTATHADQQFTDAYARRVLAHESEIQRQVNDGIAVPEQEPVESKSISTIILQLIKRWRNVMYEPRPDRRPPSVMLAAMVVEAQINDTLLLNGLIKCVRYILDALTHHSRHGTLIRVCNPTCERDCFTDRWPASPDDQDLFISDLGTLLTQLERLSDDLALDEMQQVMVELFGESPTKDAFTAFNRQRGESIRSGQTRYDPATGRLLISGAVVPGQVGDRTSRPTPKHTFYGKEN